MLGPAVGSQGHPVLGQIQAGRFGFFWFLKAIFCLRMKSEGGPQAQEDSRQGLDGGRDVSQAFLGTKKGNHYQMMASRT